MMRNLIIIITSLLLSTSTSWANQEIEELNARYHGSSTDEKIEVLFKLYFLLEPYDLDSCFYYISNLQDIGFEESREDAIAMSNYLYGHYLLGKSLYSEAINKFESAEKYYDFTKNDTLLVEVTNGIGNAHFLRGDLLKAETYYLKAISFAERTKDDRFILIPYPNLARVYMNQGKLEEAEKLLDDYITYYTSLSKLRQLANSVSLKGQLYLNKEEPEKAIKYFEQSLEYNLSLGSFRQIANGFTNMAIASFYTDELDKAEQYFRLAMSYREQDGSDFFIAEAYYNMGDFFIETAVYDSALYYYDRSLQVSLKSQNKIGEIDAYKSLAEVYGKTGNKEKQIEFLELLIKAKDAQHKEKVEQELSLLRASFDAFARETEFFNLQRESELRAQMSGLEGAREYWIWLLAALVFGLAGIVIYQRSQKEA